MNSEAIQPCLYMYPFSPKFPPPSRLAHNTEQSSMCYTVGPCQLSILNILNTVVETTILTDISVIVSHHCLRWLTKSRPSSELTGFSCTLPHSSPGIWMCGSKPEFLASPTQNLAFPLLPKPRGPEVKHLLSPAPPGLRALLLLLAPKASLNVLN